MLRDGNALGASTVTRRQVEPFTEAQIELLYLREEIARQEAHSRLICRFHAVARPKSVDNPGSKRQINPELLFYPSCPIGITTTMHGNPFFVTRSSTPRQRDRSMRTNRIPELPAIALDYLADLLGNDLGWGLLLSHRDEKCGKSPPLRIHRSRCSNLLEEGRRNDAGFYQCNTDVECLDLLAKTLAQTF